MDTATPEPNEQERPRRRCRPMSTKLKCKDNLGLVCYVKGSVRLSYISLFIAGGDEWAHMTTKQATALADWILQAVQEAESRELYWSSHG